MWLIQKCRERWLNESGKDISWDEIIALSKESAPFAIFVDAGNPEFVQAQLDMPDRILEFCERLNILKLIL
jgi:hypothetical protein